MVAALLDSEVPPLEHVVYPRSSSSDRIYTAIFTGRQMLGGRELCIGLTVTRLPSTCIPLARSSSAEILVILWRYAPVTVESVPGEDNAARHQSMKDLFSQK